MLRTRQVYECEVRASRVLDVDNDDTLCEFEHRRVDIVVERSARWLDVLVRDDGKGLPPGFSLERANGLGLQIARTLVESELRGSLSLPSITARTKASRSGLLKCRWSKWSVNAPFAW